MNLDATNLFEGRIGMNSESWWSSLFTIFAIEFSVLNGRIEFPINKYIREKDSPETNWDCFERCETKLEFYDLKYDNVYVETSIKKLFADVHNISNDISQFKNIKPDIVVINDKRIEMIENKTVQASDDSLEKYADLCNILNGNGYSAKLYLLASKGLSQDSVWSIVNEHELPVILWEDVFKKMDEYGYSSKIFGRQLDRYY